MKDGGFYTLGWMRTIAVAHYLNLPYKSPCVRLHGHNIKVEVKIGSLSVNNWGMIIDFSRLKEIIPDHVLILTERGTTGLMDKVVRYERGTMGLMGKVVKYETKSGHVGYVLKDDEGVLILPKGYKNTTVEELSRYFTDRIVEELEKDGIRWTSVSVKLWEDENSYVEYTAYPEATVSEVGE